MTPRGESPSDDDVDDARDGASAEALLGLFMLVSALVYVDRGIASSAAVSGAPRSAREPAGPALIAAEPMFPGKAYSETYYLSSKVVPFRQNTA